MSTTDFLQLGQELDAHGFVGREVAVRSIVRDARAYGVAGIAADVLGDPTAPEVARLRAFATVALALAKLEQTARTVDRVA